MIDIEEAFSPTDYPHRFTARDMRHIWFLAALGSVRRRHRRFALEAFVNSLRRFPPVTWSTGCGIIDLKPKVIQ